MELKPAEEGVEGDMVGTPGWAVAEVVISREWAVVTLLSDMFGTRGSHFIVGRISAAFTGVASLSVPTVTADVRGSVIERS